MTATRKHNLHFNQDLSKTHILSRILSGFRKQNTKATIIFQTNVYQKRKLQTTVADVYFTTEGWGSKHVMNLYKMQSCSVGIPNWAYAGTFVSLSFYVDEIVLNNLLALLVQSNKLNATTGEGCRLKNETGWTYRCVPRECHCVRNQKFTLFPCRRLFYTNVIFLHYNSRYKKWPQNHRTSNNKTLGFYTCTFVSSYTADTEWGVW